MAKYSAKENTYKEMYLMSKFEKSMLENSLQNMRNDQTSTTQKITTRSEMSSKDENKALGDPN